MHVSTAASALSFPPTYCRAPSSPTPQRRLLQTCGYFSGNVGIAAATGLGVARAGLFTVAAAHPLAFFLTSAVGNQAALAATRAFDASHSALRHGAFAMLGVVLGAGCAAIGPVGLSTLAGASILCAGAFATLCLASTIAPRGPLGRTDRAVDWGSKAWFVFTFASLAVPTLGALRGVQVLLAVSGTGLFATRLMRNAQRIQDDAAEKQRFNAMQSAVDLAFPTFCIFTFSPSLVSAL